jgi:VanZ family protein
VELIQYYDSDRDTEATDLYANMLGTLMGAIPALFNPALVWGTGSLLKIGNRIPLLLLAAWLSYKLFPFVPVIDLHKYWHAVRPLLNTQIPAADLFRHFATWMLSAITVRFVVGSKSILCFGALFGFVMAAKIFVDGGVLSLAEICGGALALAVLALTARFPRLLAIIGTLLLTAYIAWFRLTPIEWLAVPRPFGWIPFLSLMQGSVIVDMLSFLEKFYLYGGLIWLLRECGVRLWPASITVAILLFLTSWAETYLPGRSAEITDALLALIIGVGFALLENDAARQSGDRP